MSTERAICPQCGKPYTVELAKEPDWAVNLLQWKNGISIQHAFPNAKPYQREQLQTGICSDECWDKMFGETT